MDKPHKKLDVWKLGMELVTDIYQLTASFPSEERFGFTAQMRRSAASIPTNLAEGAARTGRREFRHFVTIARASLSELDTQLDISARLGFLSMDTREQFNSIMERIDRMLYRLHDSLND